MKKPPKRAGGSKHDTKKAASQTRPLRMKSPSAAAPSAPGGPFAARPQIPGYGIVGEKDGRGLLPWSWAEEHLAAGRNYWVATTRPDGRPHVMPVWGVWWQGAFWFSTGDKTVKARNLAANPHCTICPERGDEAVILEGKAQWVAASDALKPMWDAYQKKYAWDVKGSGFYAVRPSAAFGFIETGDLFTKTATRWKFGAPAAAPAKGKP
jgi:nitroimidazol reductase NimA-like FMN-containing flavoprotein (pyridoxamine 5'-phosphate oxidase superfamily)